MSIAAKKKKGLLAALRDLVETLLLIAFVAWGLNSVFGVEPVELADKKTPPKVREHRAKARPKPSPRPAPIPIPNPVRHKTVAPPVPMPQLADDAEPRQGIMILSGLKKQESSEIYDQRLRKKSPQKLDYPTLWQYGETQQTYLLTAMGRDQQHHVANAFLIGFAPLVTENMWLATGIIAQRMKYQYDHHEFGGKADIWQTSKQAYFWLRGDCEDHAILLADWLIDMGIDARVVVGSYQNSGHAWVVVIKDGQTMIMEATEKKNRRLLPLTTNLTGYRPQFMFNRDSFWINTGTTLTTSYTDKKWLETARFVDLTG